MTNEELSQQIAALTATVTEKFNEIDKRFETIDGRLDKLQAGQDDLATKYDNLKAGQDNLVAKHADLQVGLDDLRTKYGEMNEKQGYIVNAQKTIAKTQDELQRALEEDFTDMKATQASIQHDIARINRKMIVETGVRDTMHESVFTTQDSHYRDLDRRLRLVEAHFPELG